MSKRKSKRAAHLAVCGQACPSCGSPGVIPGGTKRNLERYAGTETRAAIYQNMSCTSCAHTWQDHFILVSLVEGKPRAGE